MNDYAIMTEGLSRKFGSKWAVQDLNLKVPKGSVFGLLGPNGAGKSTTINMLMGLLPPTNGNVQILGMNPFKNDIEVKRKVGYVAEMHGFYEWMTVDETIRLVSSYHPHWNQERCRHLMNEFKLDENEKVGVLSKGTKAKLALLLAISYDPEILILDEPTSGLDPAARRNFIETILGQFQDEGKTILVSSHLLNEFSGLIDHVAFIRESKLEIVSRLDELQQKTKRIRLIFENGTPRNLVLQNTYSTSVNGREAIVVIRNFDAQKTIEEMKSTGASNILVEEMSLEDIFVEMVGS